MAADTVFEHTHLDRAFGLGDADGITEGPNRFRRITPPTQPGNGRHSGIVPAIYPILLHQLSQLALAHYGVFKIESRELNLTRMTTDTDVVEHPIIQRPMIFEFERTQRMRDPLDRIRDRVCVVVHRVDAPFIIGLVMNQTMAYTIQCWVTHVDVRRGHVDTRAQRTTTILKLAGTHTLEQIEALINRAFTVWAFSARLGQSATVLTHLLRC